MCDTRHAQVHTNLGTFAAEIRLQLIQDICLIFCADICIVLHGLTVDAILMLCCKLHLAVLHFRELAARNTTLGTFLRSGLAFIYITTYLTYELLHDCYLLFFYNAAGIDL